MWSTTSTPVSQREAFHLRWARFAFIFKIARFKISQMSRVSSSKVSELEKALEEERRFNSEVASMKSAYEASATKAQCDIDSSISDLNGRDFPAEYSEVVALRQALKEFRELRKRELSTEMADAAQQFTNIQTKVC